MGRLHVQSAHPPAPARRQCVGRHRRTAQAAPRSHSIGRGRSPGPRRVRAQHARGVDAGAEPRDPGRDGRRTGHPRARGGSAWQRTRAGVRCRRGVSGAARGGELRRATDDADRCRRSFAERASLLQRRGARLQYGDRAIPCRCHRRHDAAPSPRVLRTRRSRGARGAASAARVGVAVAVPDRACGAALPIDRAIRRADRRQPQLGARRHRNDHGAIRRVVERTVSHHSGRLSHTAGLQLDAGAVAGKRAGRGRTQSPHGDQPRGRLRQIQDLDPRGAGRGAHGRAPLSGDKRAAVLR